jgi:hypothetical protein
MFRTLFLTAILTLAAGQVYSQAKQKAASEEDAIREVIENESKYFWARDLKKWKSYYIQAPYTERTVASTDVVRRYYGWDEWYNEVQQLFKDSPDPVPYDGIVKKSNYNFRIYGNGAWVSFEQDNGGTKTLETRILEKEKGKWKIAMVHIVFGANRDLESSAGGE